MKYFLAVDGGGTKTHVLCVDESGKELGEGISGPTNLTVTNVGSATFNLQEAMRQSMQTLPQGERIARLVMGLAGLDSPAEIQSATQIFKQSLQYSPVDEIILVNDTVIALESGSDAKNAMVLISGTGSNCYGRNEQGQEAKAGGMDFLLADEGSAYDIGRKVLRAAVKSFDGRGPKTILEKLVCEHFQVPGVTDLKTVLYNPLISKMEVADVAKVCSAAFAEHDAVAQKIFDITVDHLFLMVSTVANKLQLIGKQCDLVFVGAITRLPYIQDNLQKKITTLSSQMIIQLPSKPPVYGAVKLAIHPPSSSATTT